MPATDLNQSSRLDLDYDAEGDFGESANQMSEIAESQSWDASGAVSAESLERQGGVDNETNGFAHFNGVRSGIIDENMNKKLVQLKLWDPGESSSAEPSVVTVVLDVPPAVGEAETMHNMSCLGVGRTIELKQHKSVSGGQQTVDISYQLQPIPTEEIWQPPLVISDEEEYHATADVHMNNRRNQPQPMPEEQQPEVTTMQSNIPKPDQVSSAPTSQTTTGQTPEEYVVLTKEAEKPKEEELPTPVNGLEPFTIPSILTYTIVKRTPTEKVGLAFRKASGMVIIEKIAPGSAFDGTALRPGYECLCINGHRLRSARRAAELVRESGSSLTLMASNAPRPPGTMYTMISLAGDYYSGADGAVMGLHFKMKHGLVQLVKADGDSPISSTSMKVGDFVLAINGSVVGSISDAVEVLSESNDDLVPILYFNMRQLRVSLVDKVMGDLWKKEWSDGYDECVVLQSGGSESSNPLTLRFKEEGMCELIDPLLAFRDKSSEVPPDHPLKSVVETLNHGIVCVLSAIRAGVELVTGEASKRESLAREHLVREEKKSDGLSASLGRLTEFHRSGILGDDDYEGIRTKLLASGTADS